MGKKHLGATMDAAAAVAALQNDPDNFMKYYPVSIAGIAGAANAFMRKRDPGVTAGTVDGKEGHYGASRPGPMGLGTRNLSSFQIVGFPGAGHHQFAVQTVPMVDFDGQVNGVADMQGQANAIPPTALGGAGAAIMVTGMLTTCTFVWAAIGGVLHCAHVQPTGPLSPLDVHNRLHLQGRFVGHPNNPVGTFGKNDYPMFAHVLGVRTGGTWRLYAQLSNNNGQNITGAYRIYPGGRVSL